MNLPAQPSSDAQTPLVDAVCAQQADTDPFFSTALNVPSGPVGTLGINFPPEAIPASGASDPQRVTPQEPNFELMEEIDIGLFQLEELDIEAPERPMPIRGAFCVDTPPSSPSIDSVNEVTMVTSTGRQPEVVVQDAVGRFIAHENSVIHIDGNEGFDYIDLSDRDIAHVTFNEASLIVVDATTNESFTIEYQNITHALFSHGHMIELQ